MNRLRFPLLLSVVSAVATLACGGISDPNKSNGVNEPIATVSGALTGTNVPAGAHVALVWRNATAGGWAVSNDVAVVGGQFTMNLTAPDAAFFTTADSSETYDTLNSGGVARKTPTVEDAPSSSGGAPMASADAGVNDPPPPSSSSSSGALPGFDFSKSMNAHPKDQVSGSITQPLQVAVAGFIVYVDSNGNNQLDLTGDYADSPDQIIGGNKELMLAFFKDGGALDYEKLRDRSSILPHAGYNLAWDEGRWMPLNVVELKLTSTTKLPSAICESTSDAVAPTTDFGGGSGGEEPNTSTPSSSGGGTGGGYGYGYPSAGDPKLHCTDNGYSWTYDGGWGECPTSPPPPVGLCASFYGSSTAPCAKMGGSSLDPDANPTAPPGWPCPIGGTAADGGVFDAGPPSTDASAPIDAGPSGSDAGI